MFKTVSLPAETWALIVRRLTVEVGADDASRQLATQITDQTTGAMKVKATRGGTNVQITAGKGGDLRKMLGIE
jgi:hypothetical protein